MTQSNTCDDHNEEKETMECTMSKREQATLYASFCNNIPKLNFGKAGSCKNFDEVSDAQKFEETMSPGAQRYVWRFTEPLDEEFYMAKLIRYRHEANPNKEYLTHIQYAAKQVTFLSTFAENEFWGDKQRILRAYLNSTFQRLAEEGKILAYQSSPTDRVVIIWNTGLLTANTVQDIYCVMVRNDNFTNKLGKAHSPECEKSCKWRIATFMAEEKFKDLRVFRSQINNWSNVEVKMTDIPDKIPLASYFSTSDSVARFIYDPQVPYKKTDVCVKHLLLHKERFSEDFSSVDNDMLVESVHKGVEISLRRVRHNYRLAIPQYFRDKNSGHGVVQLLLPIRLKIGEKELPEIAVALQYEYDHDKPCYVVKTLFTLEMAYSNARLLQKIDQSWLTRKYEAVVDPYQQATYYYPNQSYVYYPNQYYQPIYYPNYAQYEERKSTE